MNPDAPDAFEVASPCVDVCVMDPESGLCRGCLRTIAEIMAWASADRETKLAVLAAIEARRAERDANGASFRDPAERPSNDE